MRIEIFSDVVCPWCYSGKRRFEEALDGGAAPTGHGACGLEGCDLHPV